MTGIDERAAVSAYIKARLTEEQRAQGRGYQARVAGKTKLSGSYIANLINHEHKGVGFEAAPAFAAFWNMSLTELIDAAMERARRLPPPVAHAVPRYPNLQAAIEFVKSREPVPDEIVEMAGRLAQHGRDFAVGTWIVVLGDLLQIHRAEQASPAGRPRTAR